VADTRAGPCKSASVIEVPEHLLIGTTTRQQRQIRLFARWPRIVNRALGFRPTSTAERARVWWSCARVGRPYSAITD